MLKREAAESIEDNTRQPGKKPKTMEIPYRDKDVTASPANVLKDINTYTEDAHTKDAQAAKNTDTTEKFSRFMDVYGPQMKPDNNAAKRENLFNVLIEKKISAVELSASEISAVKLSAGEIPADEMENLLKEKLEETLKEKRKRLLKRFRDTDGSKDTRQNENESETTLNDAKQMNGIIDDVTHIRQNVDTYRQNMAQYTRDRLDIYL
jgi:hypothetical protein